MQFLAASESCWIVKTWFDAVKFADVCRHTLSQEIHVSHHQIQNALAAQVGKTWKGLVAAMLALKNWHLGLEMRVVA